MTAIKNNSRFVSVVVLAHTIAYLLAGGISYQFITKEFWEGPDPILSAYLRTPGNADLWNYAMLWQVPAQFLRSLLIALVLLPLCNVLTEWSVLKRFLFFSALLFVLTHLSAGAPSPANIEGWVYMKPEFISSAFAKMQVEMLLYSLMAGLILARFGWKGNQNKL